MDTKSARIETRVSQEQKELIERAAAYSGRSVSEFVLGNVEQAAKEVIAEHERLRLNRKQSEALVDLLLSPAAPNEALKAAAKNYRRQVKNR